MGTTRSCKVELWLCKVGTPAAIAAALRSTHPTGGAGGDAVAPMAVAAGPDLGHLLG
jgi:hypothetical protein